VLILYIINGFKFVTPAKAGVRESFESTGVFRIPLLIDSKPLKIDQCRNMISDRVFIRRRGISLPVCIHYNQKETDMCKKETEFVENGLEKLPRAFYDREADTVARELLGKYLVRVDSGRTRIGKIVETEAYLGPHDLAAHSARGKTARTEVMFGPPGFAYVYMIYGMYHCMNVVTGAQGQAAAVLLRALEPVQHIADKTGGPGLLCRALNIDRELNAHDLQSNDFYIAAHTEDTDSLEIVEKPRIGVHYAGEWADKPLRFYIRENPFISRK